MPDPKFVQRSASHMMVRPIGRLLCAGVFGLAVFSGLSTSAQKTTRTAATRGKLTTKTINNQRALASKLQREGKHDEAVAAAERVVEMEKVLHEEQSDQQISQQIETLLWLGRMEVARGDFQAAETRHRTALELAVHIGRKTRPAHIQSDGVVNRICADIKQLRTKAEADAATRAHFIKHPRRSRRIPLLPHQVYKLRKEILGQDHPYTVAIQMRSLVLEAFRKQGSGDQTGAEQLFAQVMKLADEKLGKNDIATLECRRLAGGFYESIDDLERAETLYRQAIRLLQERHGNTSASVASLGDNIARIFKLQGRIDRAEKAYRHVLEIRKLHESQKYSGVPTSLENLAVLYRETGRPQLAEPLLREALKLRRTALKNSKRAQPKSTNGVADRHGATRRDMKALIKTLRLAGKHDEADRYESQEAQLGSEDLADRREHIKDLVKSSAGRDQLVFSGLLHGGLDQLIASLAAKKVAPEQVYQDVIAQKGFVFSMQRDARRAIANPRNEKLLQELELASRKLSALILHPPAEDQRDRWQQQVEQLRQQKTKLEARISFLPTEQQQSLEEITADRLREALEQQNLGLDPRAQAQLRERLRQQVQEAQSQGAAMQQSRETPTPRQLQSALADGVVLFDFIEFTRVASHSQQPRERSELNVVARHLGIFVVRKNSPIAFVDVGPSAPIAEAMEEWRRAIDKGMGRAEESGTNVHRTERLPPQHRLRKLVWSPLENHLRGVKTVLISPYGSLARLPWSALPGKKSGTYLVEDFPVAVIPIPSQLSKQAGQQDAGITPGPPSMLLVGDVDFDASPDAAHKSIKPSDRSTVPDMQFSALPGTGREIQAISELFTSSFRNAPLRRLQGGQATEQALRDLAPSHHIIHLATHGFFAPPSVREAVALAEQLAESATDESLDEAVSYLTERKKVGFYKDLLSGVVLAGANQGAANVSNLDINSADPGDDGIWTAEEVGGLNLEDVDLTVLSACETGLGESYADEGLLGLQRTLQLAGARTTIGSLWNVDDEATRALMVEFYKNLWSKRLGKLEALRQAQLTMLRQYDPDSKTIKRGLKRVQKPAGRNGNSPFYWAAFMLSGDWR